MRWLFVEFKRHLGDKRNVCNVSKMLQNVGIAEHHKVGKQGIQQLPPTSYAGVVNYRLYILNANAVLRI